MSVRFLRRASVWGRVRDRFRPWRAPTPPPRAPVVGIVGAGAAAMAAAVMLQVRGARTVLFDAATEAGGSWAGRYDSVRLNTVRWMSDLPGLRMPRSAGRWPDRDTMVAYLRSYARWHELDVRSESAVSEVRAAGRGWGLRMSAGGSELVDAVVVATGHARRPVIPDWPGKADFGGVLMHSASYRRPSLVPGRRVLVVGGGSSGGEIAAELVRAGFDVFWALRSMPHVFEREVLGLPTTPFAAVADLLPRRFVDAATPIAERMIFGRRDYLPPPSASVTERLTRGREPIVVEGLVPLLREGRLRVVDAVEELAPRGVRLASGDTHDVDAVIAATGFDAGLEELVGHLGVLDPHGLPLSLSPVPGLGFIGYRIPLAGTLWAIEIDAIALSQALALPTEARPVVDRSQTQGF